MKRFWHISAMVLIIALASGPVNACRVFVPLKVEDIQYADVVVVGRIVNYRIVRDQEFRDRMLKNPDLPSDLRIIYEGPDSLLPDYARFDIQVDEALLGEVPSIFTVTWDNSTFGEPAEPTASPVLIALRAPSSEIPPLRGPSATILPNPEPQSLTVLQAPCSGAFIFENSSDAALAIRQILAARKLR